MAGVYKKGNRWTAFYGRQREYLGTFDTQEEAQAAHEARAAQAEPPKPVSPDRPKIDPEFESLLPILTPEEFAGLETKLLAEGCREELILWQQFDGDILIDGHNRLAICEKHNLPYRTRVMHFPDRAAVIQWIVDTQLSRRNLSDERKAYYIGKEYLAKKKVRGGSKHQNDPLGATDEVVGSKHNVSPATVLRDADFAVAVDAIGEKEGEEAKQAILSGESGVGKQEVIDAAKTGGKLFCDRCTRLGPTKGCQQCAELRKAKPKPAPRKKPSKNGQEVVNWKHVKDAISTLTLTLDRLYKANECVDAQGRPKNDKAYTTMNTALTDFYDGFRKRFKALTGENAPEH